MYKNSVVKMTSAYLLCDRLKPVARLRTINRHHHHVGTGESGSVLCLNVIINAERDSVSVST